MDVHKSSLLAIFDAKQRLEVPPDGSKGLGFWETLNGAEDDPRVAASKKREAALQTVGNLTLLSTGLNSAQSNLPWDEKRPEMIKHSLLPISQNLDLGDRI